MLKQLRQKKVMKKILWVLAAIIIPAFVLWGAGGLRESKNYAGMLFGKQVSFDEYRASFNAVKNRALLTYGSQFYQMQDKLNLEDAAWDNLIMLKEARRRSIKVSDGEVIARIASFGFFQDKEGLFDQRTYNMILQSAFRTEPRKFEEEIRQAFMTERLIYEAIKDVPEPTDEEIEEALKKEAEEEEKEKEAEISKEKDEKEEEKEETLEQKRERIKVSLWITKRTEAYQKWREELYKRANLISNIEIPEEEEKKEEEIQEPEEK